MCACGVELPRVYVDCWISSGRLKHVVMRVPVLRPLLLYEKCAAFIILEKIVAAKA